MAEGERLASRLLEVADGESRPPNAIERLGVLTSCHAGERLFSKAESVMLI
jgi:hypothetical protein